MTLDQLEIIIGLHTCKFLPGSWDKRFVNDLYHKKPDPPLTDTQNEWLFRLLYKYRKQVPNLYLKYHNNPLCAKKPPRPLKVSETNQTQTETELTPKNPQLTLDYE